MKNDMRPVHARNRDHSTPMRQGSCVALIDSHYMSWLSRQGQPADTPTEPVNRMTLGQVLSSALKQSGLSVDLQRIYWYTDTPDQQFPQDQITRLVDPESAEGGDVLLLAITADLKKLSERGACQHILIASDDERLLALIDDAQLHGIAVHLLADESARHMDQLVQEDPAWCQLLAQADRLVFLHPLAAKDLTQQPKQASQTPHAPLDPEATRSKLQEVVDAWWTDEPEDLREDLREELNGTQGIPQEVDRHLLLRVRRVLERPLSFPEKKFLREIVRNKVLGVVEETQPA